MHVVPLILSPLILPNLLPLFICEVAHDVEVLPDFFWRLSPDHVGHGLAGDIKEALDVQVIGCQNQIEEGTLIHL